MGFVKVTYLNTIHQNRINEIITSGEVFKNKSGNEFIIVCYDNSFNVQIRFIKTSYEKSYELSQIRKGLVKDRFEPTVCNVGIVGDKYATKLNNLPLPQYVLWGNVLRRCYSASYHEMSETYANCTTSENFKHYTYFYEWCNEQIGFNCKDDNGRLFNIDKDLLIKGNKVYSEDTCVFLPIEINAVLVKRDKMRGDCVLGVYKHKHYNEDKFVAQLNLNTGKAKYLGLFNTEIEAFNAYKKAKENYLKELANKWEGKIDERAYNALMNYEVGVED